MRVRQRKRVSLNQPEVRDHRGPRLILGRLSGLLVLPFDYLRYLFSERFFIGRAAPIFVVGCGHSGTSIVRRIIGRNSAVHDLGPETWLLVGAGSSALSFVRFLSRRPFRVLFGYRKACLAAGRDTWVEKTPKHVLETRVIRIVAPRARIVGVIRDGRDVVASLVERGYSADDAISRWVLDTQAALRLGKNRNGTVIRYEDLVESPEHSLKSLCSNLGLPFEVAMLEPAPSEIEQSLGDTDHARRRNAQVKSPLFDGRGRWVGEFTEDQARLFDLRAGLLNKSLGYEVCGSGAQSPIDPHF